MRTSIDHINSQINKRSHIAPSDANPDLVAIKILDKKKLDGCENGAKNLITEIKVHWDIEECDSLLRLLEIYED
jgi:hypothetical protein